MEWGSANGAQGHDWIGIVAQLCKLTVEAPSQGKPNKYL
jgi:hypothetical protein